MKRLSAKRLRSDGSSASFLIHSWLSHSSLVRSKIGRRGADVAEVEELDQLLPREDLLVAVGPAEPRQVVHHRLGQDPLVPERLDRGRPVALGQALPVRPEDHRDVGEHRQRVAERLVAEDLLRRVREVVVAADHVGDLHRDVVHDHAEVVGRRAVGAHEDPVVELARSKRHVAVDRSCTTVVPASGMRSRSAAGDAGTERDVPAAAGVAEGLAARLGGLAPGVELSGVQSQR